MQDSAINSTAFNAMGFKGAHMFLPFPDDGNDGDKNMQMSLPLIGPKSMSASIKGYLDTYVYRDSKARIILSSPKAKSLTSVLEDQELYVVCHGSGKPTSTRLGGKNKEGEEQNPIDMKVLAAILKAEGLTEKAKSVHLYTCGSGLMNSVMTSAGATFGRVEQFAAGQEVSNNFPVPSGAKGVEGRTKVKGGSQAESSLAANLANELFVLGYKDIQVVGYLGNVIAGRDNKVGIKDWFTHYPQTQEEDQPPDSSVFYPYDDPMSHRLVVKGYQKKT